MAQYRSASGSAAEDLFIDLFSDAFSAEKAGYLYSQYHFYDIYQNSRYADFVLENGARRIAIEIDDETSHNKSHVASNKFYDDLLKQNSMVHLGWDVYRWAVRQMQIQAEAVKDELRVFLGSHPQFKEIEDYLPQQRGKALDGTNLELKKAPSGSFTLFARDARPQRNHCSFVSCDRYRKNCYSSHGCQKLWRTRFVSRPYTGTNQPSC